MDFPMRDKLTDKQIVQGFLTLNKKIDLMQQNLKSSHIHEQVLISSRICESFEDWLLQLIWDLQIEAERNNPHKDYSRNYIWIKKHHPKNHRPNNLEPIERFRCSRCGYFHSSNYNIGKKPLVCRKCHNPFALKP